MYTVYSRDGCSYCNMAITLLTVKKLPFKIIKIGEDILREDFVTQYPDQKTVPLILKGQIVVGGYRELADSLKEPFTEF